MDYLEQNFGERALNGLPGHLDSLKEKVKRLQTEYKRLQQTQTRDVSSDEESESEYFDDATYAEMRQWERTRRMSVSAEAFGNWNQRKQFFPPNEAKSPEKFAQIKEQLEKSFMFQHLETHEKLIVINAMKEIEFDSKTEVIREGDEGDCLYVVGSGTLQCSRITKANAAPTFVRTYQPGEVFGELSLLYNTPRAATITTNEECTLWRLDRETFNHILRDSSAKRRQKYEQILKQIPFLQSLSPYERQKLADVFIEKTFQPGHLLYSQGDTDCNQMFIVMAGEARGSIYDSKKSAYTEVAIYKRWDCFGEKAILSDEPRDMTVTTLTECTLAILSKVGIQRLMGSLESLQLNKSRTILGLTTQPSQGLAGESS